MEEKITGRPLSFDDYLNRYGYFQYEKNGNSHWVRYYEYEYEEYGRHYYNKKYLEPALAECFNNREEKTCLPEYPITIDGYNSFARWDVWKGGYVKDLGYVGEPASSVDYGCSLYLNSWIRRGAVENPVHVYQFYDLVNKDRWRGGEVSTWGHVSSGTKILGSSLSFETVESGENTIGGMMNLGRSLGKSISAEELRTMFKQYYNTSTEKYEIDDETLCSYFRDNFCLYNVFGNNDVEAVKNALNRHRAVFMRVVTEKKTTGSSVLHKYGDDYLVVDYYWLKQQFVGIDPLTKELHNMSEEAITKGEQEVIFYVIDKQ